MTWMPALLLATANPASAIEIRIDYTYDTGNFFNTVQKRAAMEAVADFYGSIIADKLLRIDPADFPVSTWAPEFTHPSTGASISGTTNMVVPEDTMIIYVGARPLTTGVAGQGGPGGYSASTSNPGWFDRLKARGNPGALAVPATDFAPWGGSVAFNSASTWNFSLTVNQPGIEFVRVALHEIGHALGIGTAPAWRAQISGGKFIGEAAIRSHGTAPPADFSHLVGPTLNSKLFGSFGVTHGLSRPALMLPGATDTGTNFDVATDLDLACLVDIGWEIRPVPKLKATALSPAAASFNWPSVSFLEYRVARGADLATFPGGSGVLPGNGGALAWADPAPPATRAFYRLEAAPIPQAVASAMAAEVTTDVEGNPAAGTIITLEVQYPWVDNCTCPHH